MKLNHPQEVMLLQNGQLDNPFQTGDLFSSYFSILLLFLIGLNRVGVYTSPWLMKNFFPRRRLMPVLVILAILTLAFSIFMFLQTGMERVMQTDGVYQDYVEDMTLMNVSGVTVSLSLSLYTINLVPDQQLPLLRNRSELMCLLCSCLPPPEETERRRCSRQDKGATEQG